MAELFKPDITAVFEHYDLRILPSRGSWAKAQCPMPDHEDANPSASVNEDLGKFTCFSCGAKGDALDIIGKREQIDGLPAIEQFARDTFPGCEEQPARRAGNDLHRPRTVKRARNWQPPWGRV